MPLMILIWATISLKVMGGFNQESSYRETMELIHTGKR